MRGWNSVLYRWHNFGHFLWGRGKISAIFLWGGGHNFSSFYIEFFCLFCSGGGGQNGKKLYGGLANVILICGVSKLHIVLLSVSNAIFWFRGLENDIFWYRRSLNYHFWYGVLSKMHFWYGGLEIHPLLSIFNWNGSNYMVIDLSHSFPTRILLCLYLINFLFHRTPRIKAIGWGVEPF